MDDNTGFHDKMELEYVEGSPADILKAAVTGMIDAGVTKVKEGGEPQFAAQGLVIADNGDPTDGGLVMRVTMVVQFLSCSQEQLAAFRNAIVSGEMAQAQTAPSTETPQ